MPSLKSMPLLADTEPLEGAVAPDPGTYEPAGNKFTRLHSPGPEEDDRYSFWNSRSDCGTARPGTM